LLQTLILSFRWLINAVIYLLSESKVISYHHMFLICKIEILTGVIHAC
jgi:hypothetical protein